MKGKREGGKKKENIFFKFAVFNFKGLFKALYICI